MSKYKKYLLFSDIHGDTASCEYIVKKSKNADVLIGAGDYALMRKGLEKTIDALSRVSIPVILVPGNHESLKELAGICHGLKNFHVLHGNSVQVNETIFFGIGCGIPTTPFEPWSVDLTEEEARQYLATPHKDFIFITHSPPLGCLDEMFNRQHVGSITIRDFIEKNRPSFVVCGHIHENWNQQSRIDDIPVINAGPFGYDFIFPSVTPAIKQNQGP